MARPGEEEAASVYRCTWSEQCNDEGWAREGWPWARQDNAAPVR